MLKIFVRAGIAALVVVLAAFILLVATQPKPERLPPLPVPNGYTNLIHAAHMIEGDVPSLTASPDELRGFLSTNQTALAFARFGLRHSCRVPTEFTPVYLNRHVLEMGLLKRLAGALAVAGRVAELDQRNAEALKIELDIVRLGQECPRGGVLLDKLVGMACESIGLARLSSLVSALQPEQCRELAHAIEAIDAQEDPVADVLKRENIFSRQAFGLRGQVVWLFTWSSRRDLEESCVRKVTDRARERRRLLLTAAVRAYEQDNGTPPKAPADLVPAYLKAIPKDPTTGSDLHY
jgi:hypothetical protein